MALDKVKVTLNGQTYNLTFNEDSGAYEGTITAPNKSSYTQPEHFYEITVIATDTAGNSATEDSGNELFGSQLKLKVVEAVKPVIAVIYPTDGAVLTNTDTPTISWNVSDDDSGVNEKSISLLIDGIEADSIIKSEQNGIYTCAYSKTLEQGKHTIEFSVSDNDGNIQSNTISIKIDTVPPTLNISSPSENIVTNQIQLTVSGYTNDALSSPVTVTVNGESVTVQSNGYFETNLSLIEGENLITIISTDSSGLKTEITRTVILDTKNPIISSVTCTPSTIGVGGQFKISVVATDE